MKNEMIYIEFSSNDHVKRCCMKSAWYITQFHMFLLHLAVELKFHQIMKNKIDKFTLQLSVIILVYSKYSYKLCFKNEALTNEITSLALFCRFHGNQMATPKNSSYFRNQRQKPHKVTGFQIPMS